MTDIWRTDLEKARLRLLREDRAAVVEVFANMEVADGAWFAFESDRLKAMKSFDDEINEIERTALLRHYVMEYKRTPDPLRPVPFVTDGLHT